MKTHTYPDTSIAGAKQTFPVLIFSHGHMMLHSQNSVLMEELASHGYIVFSIGHVYDAPFIEKSDGQVKIYAYDQGLTKELDDRKVEETMKS